MGDCKKCPFYKTEPVPEDLAGKVNLTEWSSCDVDAVGLAAADRIANQSTHIAALQKEIEKLRGQVPRWIPVEERLPEYGVRVLATDMYEEDDCTGIWTREEYPDDPEDGCWIDDRGWWHAFDDVTHWMPLPDRPEAEKALEAMKDE
jgi:hypothetical protein